MSHRDRLRQIFWFTTILVLAPCASTIPVSADPPFVSPPHYFDFWIYEMVVEDFNNNGVLDIMPIGGGPIVLLGRGDGLFDSKISSWPYYSGGCLSITSSDFDLDGNIDVALGCYECMGGTYYAVLLGNGDGTFSKGEECTIDSDIPGL